MNEFLLEFESIRIISAVIMLGIASFYDIWKREIHDVLWIGFGAFSYFTFLYLIKEVKHVFQATTNF